MLIIILTIIYASLAWYVSRRDSMHRTVFAIVLAPLAPCFIGAALEGDIMWAIIIAPFAYLFALSGVPAYIVFRRFGWLHFWQIVAVSAALGGVMAFAGGFSSLGAGFSLRTTLVFTGYGAITGFVFWLVAFSNFRPNKNLKLTPKDGAI